MTNEQKNIIRNMRMQNETYAAISSAVGIPIGTIKPQNRLDSTAFRCPIQLI